MLIPNAWKLFSYVHGILSWVARLLGWCYEIFISQNSRGTCLDVEYILIRSRFFRNIALNFFLPFFLEIFANALSFEISDLLRFYYMLSFSNNFVERGRFMAEWSSVPLQENSSNMQIQYLYTTGWDIVPIVSYRERKDCPNGGTSFSPS